MAKAKKAKKKIIEKLPPVPEPTKDQIDTIFSFIDSLKPFGLKHFASFLKDNDLLLDSSGYYNPFRRRNMIQAPAVKNLINSEPDHSSDLWFYPNTLFQVGVEKPTYENKLRYPKPIYDMDGTISTKRKLICREIEKLAQQDLLWCDKSIQGKSLFFESSIIRFVMDIDSDGLDPWTYQRMIATCQSRDVHPWMVTTTHFGGFHIVLQGDFSTFNNLNYRMAMACMLFGEDPSDFNIDFRKPLDSILAKPIFDYFKNHHSVDPNYLKSQPKNQVARIPGTYNYNQEFFCSGDLIDTEWIWTKEKLNAWLKPFYEEEIIAPSLSLVPPSRVIKPLVASNVIEVDFKGSQDLKQASLDPNLVIRMGKRQKNRDLLEAALRHPELHLIQNFVPHFADLFSSNLTWMMRENPFDGLGISQLRMASIFGCTQRHISYMLKDLVELGYLRRDFYLPNIRCYHYSFGDKLRELGLDETTYWDEFKLDSKAFISYMENSLREVYQRGMSNEMLMRDVRFSSYLGKSKAEIEAFINDKYQEYVLRCRPRSVRSPGALEGIVNNWYLKKDKIKQTNRRMA